MAYPSEILPKNNYKLISTDRLPSKSFLLRKSLNPNANTKHVRVDELVRRFGKKFSFKELFGMSHNLYGIYKKEHLALLPKKGKGYELYWKPGDDCLSPDEIEYDTSEQIEVGIYFRIRNLHTKKFPYGKLGSTKSHQTKSYRGKLHIQHKPTRCNFWHYELEVLDSEGELITKDNAAKWGKRAAEEFVSLTLLKYASKEHTDCEIIPKEMYVAQINR